MPRDLQRILGAETLRQYELYAASVPRAKAIPEGKRLEAVLRYALRDWMESIGEGHIEDALGVPIALGAPICDTARMS
jgi:hypothetical protein